MNSAQRAYNSFQGLPLWAKGVLAVGLSTVAIVVGFKVYNGIHQAILKAKEGSAVKDAAKEMDSLLGQGQKPSFQDSQYQAWAHQIQSQFEGCDTSVGAGTVVLTESARVLVSIITQLKNDVDFLKLVKAFDVYSGRQCALYPFTKSFTGDIFKWVTDELDSYEVGYVNDKLAGQGIKYKF